MPTKPRWEHNACPGQGCGTGLCSETAFRADTLVHRRIPACPRHTAVGGLRARRALPGAGWQAAAAWPRVRPRSPGLNVQIRAEGLTRFLHPPGTAALSPRGGKGPGSSAPESRLVLATSRLERASASPQRRHRGPIARSFSLETSRTSDSAPSRPRDITCSPSKRPFPGNAYRVCRP